VNKTELLKKLLPGFLPLFVFIAADEIWGTKIGLIVAVVFGIAQLIFTFIREKRFDKFVIFDTGLIVIMGVISIVLENDIFFKLKPVLIGLILVVILGISAFTPNNFMLNMSKRYMKGVEINDAQIKQLTTSIKAMFFIFLAHTLLVFYSAFYMSKEAWVFISGGLFYILFGSYFAFEFIRNKLKAKNLNKEEWLPLVDDKGKVIGKAPRSICHSGQKLLHPVIHLHIINKSRQLYLQKRPAHKQVQPNKWDTAVGGHVSINETIEDCMKREALEEIGIKDFNAKLIVQYKWESDIEKELVITFIAQYNEEIIPNTEEVDEGKFWSIKQIQENLGKNVFTPNFEIEFDLLRKRKII